MSEALALARDALRFARAMPRVKGHLSVGDLTRLGLAQALGRATPGDIIAAHARRVPARSAVVWEGRRRTYAELSEIVERIASGARALGVAPGERALVFMGNRLEFPELNAGLTAAGAAAVPVSSRLKHEELAYVLRDSRARLLVFGPEQAPVVRRLVAEQPDATATLAPGGRVALEDADLAAGETPYARLLALGAGARVPRVRGEARIMMYTSGTTGEPKGAARRTDRAFALIACLVDALEFREDDVHLVACPFYHAAPSAMSLATTILGGTIVVASHWDPERYLAQIAEHRVTTAFLVPFMLRQLADLPDAVVRRHDLRSLRRLMSSAERLPQPLRERLLDRFGDVLYEFYGSTETGLNTLIGPHEMRRKPDSVGRVFTGNRLVILGEDGKPVPTGEVGRVFVYSRAMMDGYHGRPDATRESSHGKYLTVGDLGRVDADGYLYLVGRASDMVISAGVNIYPAEVEKVLRRHAAVADVAIVGVPDARWGEALYAYVVPREGTAPGAEELIAFAGEHLAGYKKPRHVELVEELPRNPTGKVLKRVLRERAAATLAAAGAAHADATGAAPEGR